MTESVWYERVSPPVSHTSVFTVSRVSLCLNSNSEPEKSNAHTHTQDTKAQTHSVVTTINNGGRWIITARRINSNSKFLTAEWMALKLGRRGDVGRRRTPEMKEISERCGCDPLRSPCDWKSDDVWTRWGKVLTFFTSHNHRSHCIPQGLVLIIHCIRN